MLLAPAPEEKEHQQAILRTVLRWSLCMVPLAVVVYAGAYLRHPSGLVLALLGAMGLAGGVCVWGLGRVRRGELRAPTRLLLALFLLVVTLNLLARDEHTRASVVLAYACLVLLAFALEPPAVALVWSSAAVVSLAGGLLATRFLDLPTMAFGPGQESVAEVATLLNFLLLALLGRSTTRHYRRALATSEAARAALDESNARLEQQRAELEQAEPHLSAVVADLDRSNRELQGLAQAVSGDLLAPLAALARDSRALQEEHAGQLDETGRGHVQAIVESARNMDALVNGLLAYASVTPPREPEVVDVGALVEQVASALDLRRLADLTLPAGALRVRADRLGLEHVFSSLLDNAVKFRRPGIRPAIAIEWADRGEAWELAMRDNGIGIEPRHFEKVFGLFQRLHLQSEYEGTGLGLALVRKVVEEHGGKVWIESTPGAGSVFRFTLLKREEAVAAPAAGAVRGAAPRLEAEQDPELSVEGQRLQRRLVSIVLGLVLGACPLFVGIYAMSLVRELSGWTLLSATAATSTLLVAAWGRWHLRRSDATLPARALLFTMMAAVVQHMLHREEMVLLNGTSALALLLTFAIALERPSLAFRWLAVTSALHVAAIVLRSSLPMPSLGMGPVALELLRYTPVIALVMFCLFGRATTQSLRRALARSQGTRGALEQANARLEGQRAELLKAQGPLAALTTRLTRSNRELQSFAYVASHDLRAPLRALRNYSRFLQEDCAHQLDEGGRERVERIARDARHIDTLVAALLEYSRIGRIRVEPGWVNLNELLRRVSAYLRLGDQAEVLLPVDLPTVWGMELRLQQILSHLLDNAVKFRREGVRPSVAIEWADRGDVWELAVRDNGLGIEEKDFRRIFGIFQRLHPPERYGGTGIGLAVVKKAVEEHGGWVWVESVPGRGSVFRFTLPKPAPRGAA